MKSRYLVALIVLASFAAIGYGLYTSDETTTTHHKYIGFGVIGLFFIAMPLFLFTESKGKQMKDYMLTKENIEKMRKKESKNTDNQ
ncbi:hypothetical protein [Croceivirga radicis]|uniref:Isoleucyl-tRNA synthetase n=1 Tax=Croceivirga radicis TaxID=1929488 RepID=A0A1V6LVM8_9FLAO|nr:hypothetical protein [Croceivirga radicis]OQD44066.1 hypothetical protein BUL40_00485 [Croceivirga radicis]